MDEMLYFVCQENEKVITIEYFHIRNEKFTKTYISAVKYVLHNLFDFFNRAYKRKTNLEAQRRKYVF